MFELTFPLSPSPPWSTSPSSSSSLQLLGASPLPLSRNWLPDLGTLTSVRYSKLGLRRNLLASSRDRPLLHEPGKGSFLSSSSPPSACFLELIELLLFTSHRDKPSSVFESSRPSSAPSSRLASIEPSSRTSTIASDDTSSSACSSRLGCGTLRLVSPPATS